MTIDNGMDKEPRISMDKVSDMVGAEFVEVEIRHDGKVLWINRDGVCVCRICRIDEIRVLDRRVKHGNARTDITG